MPISKKIHNRRHEWAKRLSQHFAIPIPSMFNAKNKKSLFYHKKNMKYISLSFVILIIIMTPCFYVTFFSSKSLELSCNSDNNRNLLSNHDKECFPKATEWYYAIFCFLGTLYMFIALSIVCDEFFVPSLETITLKNSISNDVAGATLMAAGGSAPELFTSLIGTFQETDIGFAAIVGSAVFNVLFVIGICALSSPKPLQLTWWPLFRDCTYYSFGLSILSIFFIPISGKEIEWFESLILFTLYIGYVIFMKYNQNIYKFIKNKIESATENDENLLKLTRRPTKLVLAELNEELEFHKKSVMMMAKDNNYQIDPSNLRSPPTNDTIGSARSRTVSPRKSVFLNNRDLFLNPCAFRAGMINILLKDKWNLNEVVSISVVNHIVGDVKETFDKLDADNNGYLDISELARLLNGLNGVEDGSGNNNIDDFDDDQKEEIENLMKELDLNHDDKISYQEFSIWYIRSEQRILGELKYIFDTIDKDESGVLTVSEIRAFLLSLDVDKSHEEIEELFKSLDIPLNDKKDKENNNQVIKHNGMSFEQFKVWFISTPYYQEKLNVFTKQAECVEATKMENILEFPNTFMARFWFILTIPLIILFIWSIPDTRKPGLAKYCYLSFAISILWIGFFSYFLVEWTSILGDTLEIPLVIMGLTFLAAGTSIPDLLSSVIVAKQGYGDMALSSSIGSNIFDILVGLPIPWLLYSIYYNGDPVIVNADALEISILILLAMLIIIIVIIKVSNWKMTKNLGIIMIILYFIFVAQDLARADYDC